MSCHQGQIPIRLTRHCERSEAIRRWRAKYWIASLPVRAPRNDGTVSVRSGPALNRSDPSQSPSDLRRGGRRSSARAAWPLNPRAWRARLPARTGSRSAARRRARACAVRCFPGSRRCRRRHATPRAERGRCRSGSRNPRACSRCAMSPAPRKERFVAVEADHAMVCQVGERARLAEAREIVAMRVEADARGADAPCDQAALGRTHHAHRDVGVAPRRSSLRLVSASSIAMPGWSARNAARIGGSTSQPITSLAVTRTTPRSAAASPEAVRAKRRGRRRHRLGVRRQAPAPPASAQGRGASG